MQESWDLFMAMQSQWRYAANGLITGLDYNSFPIVAKLYKISDEVLAFEDMRLMERATLEIAHKSK